jgi:hypothetical protein
MFTFADKAWVAGLVSFGAMTAATFWGIQIDPTVQAGIVGLLTGAFTFWVPNKRAPGLR